MVVPEANRAFVAERLGTDPVVAASASPTACRRGGPVPLHRTRRRPRAARDRRRRTPPPPRVPREVGPFTLFHSGDAVPYEGMDVELRRLAGGRPIDVALLPINGRRPERRVPGNFWGDEAATFAHAIGAGSWCRCTSTCSPSTPRRRAVHRDCRTPRPAVPRAAGRRASGNHTSTTSMTVADRPLTVETVTVARVAKTIDHSLLKPELTVDEVLAGCDVAAELRRRLGVLPAARRRALSRRPRRHGRARRHRRSASPTAPPDGDQGVRGPAGDRAGRRRAGHGHRHRPAALGRPDVRAGRHRRRRRRHRRRRHRQGDPRERLPRRTTRSRRLPGWRRRPARRTSRRRPATPRRAPRSTTCA